MTLKAIWKSGPECWSADLGELPSLDLKEEAYGKRGYLGTHQDDGDVF